MITTKFISLSPSQKVHLSNATHLNFMQMFVENFAKYTTENADYNGYLKTLKEAIAKEDSLFALSRASEHTVPLHEAEFARDLIYKSVDQAVTTYAGLPKLPKYEAASKLKRVLDNYGYNNRWTARKKMGTIASLVGDLQGEVFTAHVEMLGLTQDVAALKEQNDLVRVSLNTRNNELSLLKNGALKSARLVTDAAYDDFTQFAESMCCFFKDKKLEALIVQTNVEIKNLNLFELTDNKPNKEDVPADQQGGAPQANQPGAQQQGQNPPQANQPSGQQQGGQQQGTQQQGGTGSGETGSGNTGTNGSGGTSSGNGAAGGSGSAGDGTASGGGTPSGGNGATGGAPQGGTDGSQSSGSGTGDSGNGPIYTPVKPAVM